MTITCHRGHSDQIRSDSHLFIIRVDVLIVDSNNFRLHWHTILKYTKQL